MMCKTQEAGTDRQHTIDTFAANDLDNSIKNSGSKIGSSTHKLIMIQFFLLKKPFRNGCHFEPSPRCKRDLFRANRPMDPKGPAWEAALGSSAPWENGRTNGHILILWQSPNIVILISGILGDTNLFDDAGNSIHSPMCFAFFA